MATSLPPGSTDFLDTDPRPVTRQAAGRSGAAADRLPQAVVDKLMGMAGVALSVNQLQDLGVRRISVGPSLARAALGAFHRAALEIRDQGTFNYAEQALPFAQLNALFHR